MGAESAELSSKGHGEGDGTVASSPGDPWVLAIDFGTTSSVIGARIGDRPPEVVEVAGERRFPSTVIVSESGELVVGRVAEDLAAAAPDRALRAPKSHLGEPHPVILGGRPYEVTDLVAAILHRLSEAATTQIGSPPAEVRMTYPATWNGPRRERLRDAATRAGVLNTVLVPEPVAAAVAYADNLRAPPDGVVAVYDLGGGTFDTALLRAQGSRWFEVLGRPTGDGQLGGELFDELLLEAVSDRLDAVTRERLQVEQDQDWRRAATRLRAEVRRAKETMSEHPYADIVAATPTGLQSVRVTRSELERILTPYVSETVDILHRTIRDSGVSVDQLDAICLSGGASRTPLVRQMLTEGFPGVHIDRRGDPKASIATGAAVAASQGTGLSVSRPRSPGTLIDSPPPLQPPHAPAPAGRKASPRRRWELPAAIAAGVVLVAGAATGGLFAAGGPGHSSTPTTLSAALAGGGRKSPKTTGSATTSPPTTPTTAPAPTTTTPVTVATQAQVDAAVLSPSDFVAGALTPAPAILCGNYPRPTVYKLVGYQVKPNGTNLGTLLSGAFGYPSVALAERALAAIPPTVPGCFPNNPAHPFKLSPATGQDLCDQTYLGYADKVEVAGKYNDLYVGVVRCGATLEVLEWLLPRDTAYEHNAPAFPKPLHGILADTAEQLSHALQ